MDRRVWTDVYRLNPKYKDHDGGGAVRHNTTVLCPIYYADDVFRPLWAIFRAQKYT